jgi:hypothetical protein
MARASPCIKVTTSYCDPCRSAPMPDNTHTGPSQPRSLQASVSMPPRRLLSLSGSLSTGGLSHPLNLDDDKSCPPSFSRGNSLPAHRYSLPHHLSAPSPSFHSTEDLLERCALHSTIECAMPVLDPLCSLFRHIERSSCVLHLDDRTFCFVSS